MLLFHTVQVCFFIVGMLALYSANIRALKVEKLISPPTTSRRLNVVRGSAYNKIPLFEVFVVRGHVNFTGISARNGSI